MRDFPTAISSGCCSAENSSTEVRELPLMKVLMARRRLTSAHDPLVSSLPRRPCADRATARVMIEFVALFFLCRKMGAILRDKGWTKVFWMQVAVVFAWFGSAFIAALIYTISIVLTDGLDGAEKRVLAF